MIDRIRLTAAAKVQLSTLKRKTGIEHYNSLCRHALCLSLANASMPPEEELNFNGGVEIDWRTFAGGHETLYLNIIMMRVAQDGYAVNEESVKKACAGHLHRGLSYLASKGDDYLYSSLAMIGR